MFVTREKAKPWDHTRLRRSFEHAETIVYNYAQSDQDIFVLSILNGLKDGCYLELGAAWPEHISNTALLERKFNWKGISVDYQETYQSMWLQAGRTNQLLKQDALTLNFSVLLKHMPATIDYLSIDCDPGDITYRILQRIPFDQYKFKVITFEHDAYNDGPAVKIASRQFLSDLGYELVVNNISHMGIAIDYEDWWVHPDLVDANRVNMLKCVDDSVKDHQKYLYYK